MSNWIEVKKNDISLSSNKEEIHFLLYSDGGGNTYCSAKVEDVKKVITKGETK
jgi:hypothetical protein